MMASVHMTGGSRRLSIDDQLNVVAVGVENDHLGGMSGPWRRRTEHSSTTRQTAVTYLGVRVGTAV